MGMNLGIIGAGAIGNVHADTATRAGIPIAGVWDVNPAKGAAFRKKHSTARACASVKELLAMKEVDAVVVAVPNVDHAQVACEALEAGKTVFLENRWPSTLRSATRSSPSWNEPRVACRWFCFAQYACKPEREALH